MADVGCLSVSSTALTVGNGCITFISTAIPFLRTYYFDYDKNKNEFVERKNEAKSKKGAFNMQLALATRDQMIPQEDVVNWIHDYKVKIQECDLLEKDLEPNSGRRCCPCKICKLNQKLLEKTQKITELTTRYDKFRGCMFIKDLNSQILDNFKDTKHKFEALTAFRSLEEVSDQSDGIEKWRREYEKIKGQYVEMKRKCDGIENKLKNYNTEEGESVNVGMEDLEKMTTEMTEFMDRYNLNYSFQNIKKKFDAIIQAYRRDRKEAEINGKIPTELVKGWMDDCEKLQKKYDRGNTEIQTDAESSHHQEQLTCQMEEMENLITQYYQCNGFSNMFVDQPLETAEKRMTEYKALNSMEEKKKTVYAALHDEMVIRLLGMGGVGKTTLMQQINNEMLKSSEFKFVIWVTTTYADIKNIQNQISHRLNLPWFDKDHITVRAKKLSAYFKGVDGRCLFIFDGVWGALDLKEIGIPNGNYGIDGMNCCKIILTTRDKNIKVINGMLPKDIEMDLLDEDESWNLFEINASIDDKIDDGIKELAKIICGKCAGLPLAITVIAKMLHREEEKAIWYETLTDLNKNDPSQSIPNLLNDVYIPLKLSYDRLEKEYLKIGFLICSLFPEGHEIKLNELINYVSVAGEIAESCKGLNACRNIFIHLKNKGLLHDVKEDSARMHKVIRDVARKIAKDEFRGFFNNAELIWQMEKRNNLRTRYNQFISLQNKKEFDAMIESYRRQRKLAEKDGMIPTELVRVWMDDCEKLQKKYGGGNTEIQAEGESSRSQEELIWQMKEMKNLTTRYDEFSGSMFIVDLNRQILDNFKDTKHRFEDLAAFRSLEEVSDQSDGIEKWRPEYEVNGDSTRQCRLRKLSRSDKMLKKQVLLGESSATN